MLTLDQALVEILRQAEPLPPQQINLAQSLGRVLRQDLTTDRPLPPFDRVTMDGFAVRSADFALSSPSLKIIGELAAGVEAKFQLQPGQAIRIMTGAVAPPGADAVIQVEKTQVQGDQVSFSVGKIDPGLNIAQKGEDALAGHCFLKSGPFITPALQAFAASIGKGRLWASPDLRLAVLSTGDELVSPEQTPLAWQIRDANGPALQGMAEDLNLQPKFLGICPDKAEALKAKISEGLQGDVLLLSGGVSMGEYDLVPKILKQLGVKEVFHRVWIKPGKPIWYGRGPAGTHVVGLPGNPVSAQTGFKLFVEPLILSLLGHQDPLPTYLKLPLLQGVKKKTEREALIPAKIITKAGQSGAEEVKISGSGDFSNLILSDGLLRLPAEATRAEEGDLVPFLAWRRR